MEGGRVWRAAARVAGLVPMRRGLPPAPPAEQSVRNALRPVSAVLSSGGPQSAGAAPLHTAADFTHDDGLVMEAGEPTPRVVFGEVPSYEEARAAAAQLINHVWLSSNASVSEGSTSSEASVQSPVLSGTETESSVIEATPSRSMPNHVRRAFELVSTNPEVQDAVASVVSDRNIWNAFLQNPAVNRLLHSHQTAARVESEESPEIFGSFRERLQNFKVTMAEMLSNVSEYFDYLFGSSEATSSGVNGNTRASFMDTSDKGKIVMRLAILMIMVVLLKRV